MAISSPLRPACTHFTQAVTTIAMFGQALKPTRAGQQATPIAQKFQSTSQSFNEGDFIPTTILYTKAGGSAQASFSLTLPDGSSRSDFTNFFLQPLPGDVWSSLSEICGPPPLPPHSCAEASEYSQYYSGAGVTIDPSNFGNYDAPTYPPNTIPFPNTWGQTTAI